MALRTAIRNSDPYRLWSVMRGYLQWQKTRFAAPSPHYIKQSCLIRNGVPNATWVETGTFLGQTTQFLSKYASTVYSIEPEPKLFENAKNYFRDFSNVSILHGASEDIFPTLLPKISGDVNFWLDGHYSSGITFKGRRDTPIVEELESITSNLDHFRKVCVLVDDLRCFNPAQTEYAGYPPLDFLVDWARQSHFHWHIEHDIFVARN